MRGGAGKQVIMQGGSNGATPCATCYGVDGSGNAAAGFPRLSSLTAEYMQRQIKAYRNGGRNNPIMALIAKALTDAEIRSVSGYYAQQDSVNHATVASAALLAKGRHLARHGDWTSGIPARNKGWHEIRGGTK